MAKFIQVDDDFEKRIEENFKEIKGALKKIGVMEPPEFLTPDEFMRKTKSGRWLVNSLISDGRIKYNRVGRKIFIPYSEVGRYFAGELTIQK